MLLGRYRKSSLAARMGDLEGDGGGQLKFLRLSLSYPKLHNTRGRNETMLGGPRLHSTLLRGGHKSSLNPD